MAVWPGEPQRRNRPVRGLRLTECRALLASNEPPAGFDPSDRRAYLIRKLCERWPELGPSAAMFIVNQLAPMG